MWLNHKMNNDVIVGGIMKDIERLRIADFLLKHMHGGED